MTDFWWPPTLRLSELVVQFFRYVEPEIEEFEHAVNSGSSNSLKMRRPTALLACVPTPPDSFVFTPESP